MIIYNIKYILISSIHLLNVCIWIIYFCICNIFYHLFFWLMTRDELLSDIFVIVLLLWFIVKFYMASQVCEKTVWKRRKLQQTISKFRLFAVTKCGKKWALYCCVDERTIKYILYKILWFVNIEKGWYFYWSYFDGFPR